MRHRSFSLEAIHPLGLYARTARGWNCAGAKVTIAAGTEERVLEYRNDGAAAIRIRRCHLDTTVGAGTTGHALMRLRLTADGASIGEFNFHPVWYTFSERYDDISAIVPAGAWLEAWILDANTSAGSDDLLVKLQLDGQYLRGGA